MNQRVIHVGNTAGVPEQLCNGLKAIGWVANNYTIELPSGALTTSKKLLSLQSRWAQAQPIRRQARGEQAILHVHYATSGVLFLGHHPLVVHAHGTDVRNITGARRRLLNHIFDRADLLIAATRDLLPWMPERTVYLPNPVDMTTFYNNPDLPADARDVLIFAALSEVKGAESLRSTVEQIRQRRPETTITAIEMGNKVDRFRDLGIKFLPFQTTEGLIKVLHGHKIVLGQRKLGIPGTSELQALACGRPVLMPLGDHDWGTSRPHVVDDATPEEAAKRAVTLLEDETEWSHHSQRGLEWVQRNHAVEIIAEQLAALYQSL